MWQVLEKLRESKMEEPDNYYYYYGGLDTCGKKSSITNL